MKVNIVRIGNSQGIRIPKIILEQAGLSDEVELSVTDESIVIRKYRSPRDGWEESFRAMHDAKDDEIIIEVANEWDSKEWTWE